MARGVSVNGMLHGNSMTPCFVSKPWLVGKPLALPLSASGALATSTLLQWMPSGELATNTRRATKSHHEQNSVWSFQLIKFGSPGLSPATGLAAPAAAVNIRTGLDQCSKSSLTLK